MTPVQLSLHELSQLVVLQSEGGRSRAEIVRVLVERGWPEVSAVRFVNLTLTEQRERSAQAREEEQEQEPTHQAFFTDQELWKTLVVAVFLVALFIACMVASQVH